MIIGDSSQLEGVGRGSPLSCMLEEELKTSWRLTLVIGKEGRCPISVGAVEVGDLPLTSVGGREWEGRCPMSVGAAPPTRPEAAKSEQPPQTIEENSFLDKNKSQRKWDNIF